MIRMLIKLFNNLRLGRLERLFREGILCGCFGFRRKGNLGRV